MPLKFTIRQAISTDFEDLAVLATQVWLHTYATDGISPAIARYVLDVLSVSKFATLLTQENSAVLVAEVDGNTAGYAVVNMGVACPSGSPSVEAVCARALRASRHWF
jgi:diamine N-acetyltransferase